MGNGDATREAILIAAYRLFYRNGFARVSVDAVAEEAGVTKKTLYYHFRSKDSVAAAVIEHQSPFALATVEAWLSEPSGDPGKVVARLFERFEDWASGPNFHGLGFTRIVMELADLPGHPARSAAQRHKLLVEGRLLDAFASLGVGDPEAIARQIVVLIEGANALMLIHGDTAYVRAAATIAEGIVARSVPAPPTSGRRRRRR